MLLVHVYNEGTKTLEQMHFDPKNDADYKLVMQEIEDAIKSGCTVTVYNVQGDE